MPFHASRLSYSLSAKLISGFLLVTIPSLSVMVAIRFYTLRDLTSVNQQLQEISRSLEAVQGLETAVARAVTPLSAFLVSGTSGEVRFLILRDILIPFEAQVLYNRCYLQPACIS